MKPAEMDPLDERVWAAVQAHPDTELDPPASAAAVAAFEAQLGLALPPSHRAFLLRGNGGVVGYARLFGVGRADFLDLARTGLGMRPEVEATADGPVLPFASEWGGSYYCYDLRRRTAAGEYPVLLWHHEYAEEPADRPLLWSEFAPDFTAFVQRVIT